MGLWGRSASKTTAVPSKAIHPLVGVELDQPKTVCAVFTVQFLCSIYERP